MRRDSVRITEDLWKMWITLFGKQMSVENIRMIDVLKINKKPLGSLKMGSKRLFSDEDHPADQPQEQSSIDGTKHFFAADPVPVAERKSTYSSQKS